MSSSSLPGFTEIPTHKMITEMSRAFGGYSPQVDNVRYHTFNSDIKDYTGGLSRMFKKDDSGLLVLVPPMDRGTPLTLSCFQGEVEVSQIAAGLGLTAKIYNKMCWALHEKTHFNASDLFAKLFYETRDIAFEHEEAAKLIKYLD